MECLILDLIIFAAGLTIFAAVALYINLTEKNEISNN